MRKRVTVALFVSGVLATFVGAGWMLARGSGPAAPKQEVGNMEHIQQVTDALNATGCELYGKLREEPGNVFFSPYSVETALAMVYEGARGQTATEMEGVLHVPLPREVRQPGFAALQTSFGNSSDDNQLSMGNALWTQGGFAIRPEYIDIVQRYYGGAVEQIDFQGDVQAARHKINGWVEQRTQQKVKNLFEEGTLDGLTRVVLTNAIYFKGRWERQFDATLTHEATFTPIAGKPLTVQLMTATGEDAKFGYAETELAQALELPYAGGRLSMLVLLPRPGKLEALEAQLDASGLAQWRSSLVQRRVDVFLPRFKANGTYKLNETLAGLGMPSAFSTTSADFSGMDPAGSLYIQLVVHKAVVEVNEEGTEAAAATGVSMTLRSVARPQPVPMFRADHPFLYCIIDKEHGTLLFLGRLDRPE